MTEEPDEDEAMGRLEAMLDELADYGDPPLLADAIDGGNFGNFGNFGDFGDFDTASASRDHASAGPLSDDA